MSSRSINQFLAFQASSPNTVKPVSMASEYRRQAKMKLERAAKLIAEAQELSALADREEEGGL